MRVSGCVSELKFTENYNRMRWSINHPTVVIDDLIQNKDALPASCSLFSSYVSCDLRATVNSWKGSVSKTEVRERTDIMRDEWESSLFKAAKWFFNLTRQLIWINRFKSLNFSYLLFFTFFSRHFSRILYKPFSAKTNSVYSISLVYECM